MNHLTLLGRLTNDPSVNYTPSGRVVCQFTLAVDRPFVNQDGKRDADFIPVVIWGRTAELCGNSLSKGQRALVEGRLQIRSYDAKDGSKRYIAECIADRFEFIERKGDTKPAGAGGNKPANYQQPQQPSSFDSMGAAYDGEEVPF